MKHCDKSQLEYSKETCRTSISAAASRSSSRSPYKTRATAPQARTPMMAITVTSPWGCLS